MNHIPFPNPQNADALNDYLDALAAGKQVTPESDVESTAQEFHALASRASVNIPQQSTELVKGRETVHTATLTAPVSNRTRRKQMKEKVGRSSFNWLSAAIIAGLMISMIGSAWLNREPRNPNDNLAFAPGTAEAIDGNEASSDSAPWILDFDPADCTETSGLHEIVIDYQAMPKSVALGYGIVGPAQEEDAAAAVEQYRAMRGCETLTDAWAYWTDARIHEHKRVINDQNRAELAELQAHFAEKYPNQFMAIMNDLTISPEIEAEWTAREDAGVIGQPIPLEAKLNPEFAVELSDGRIAFPATNIYSFDDPAIQARGFPEENPASTVVMIFAMENGTWKYDDSLALCLVNCENGIGDPLDPAEATWAQSWETQECVRQPMPPELEHTGDISQIKFRNRLYMPTGEPSVETALAVSETVQAWSACGFQGDDNALTSYMTPLGIINLAQIETGGAGNPFDSAPYLRHWDTGSHSLVANSSNWNQVVVLDEPIRNTTSGMQWSPMISGTTPNDANVRQMSQGFSPETATELEDGRVSLFAVPTIALEDRGAITYEGSRMHQQVPGVILKQFDDVWLIDEPILVNSGVILFSDSDAWWWAEEFDTLPFPWTQPISYAECPQDSVVNIDRENNPSGTRYSLEDYEGLTSVRDYEIIGPANPADANAVVASLRGNYACGLRGESTQAWTARFEWENRTTAGRESLAATSFERSSASDSVSEWLRTELGLTPMDMVVEQNPDELELDGSEPLIPQGLYNPAYAVEFADGRIGIIPSGVYYSGLPEGLNEDTFPGFAPMMSIFVYQDGEWLLDETLQICIGDCRADLVITPVMNDGDIPGDEWDVMATPED